MGVLSDPEGKVVRARRIHADDPFETLRSRILFLEVDISRNQHSRGLLQAADQRQGSGMALACLGVANVHTGRC